MSLPKEELDARIQKVKGLIEERGLDFVFVYFDEHNVMNGRYLTGWCPSVERGAAIISQYCDPFLIGGPEAGPYAELDSAIKETVSSLVFMVPEEEYPMAEIYSFDQISKRFFSGQKIRKIGIVGMNTIPHTIYSQLSEELKSAVIIDVTDDFERFRYVKSPWEIKMTKKAYEIADKGFQKLMKGIQEGRREYEAAAEGEYTVRKLGGDGFGYRTIIGTAERAKGIVPPASDRLFRKGEIVITGIAPRYNGYNATACFPVVVGDKPDRGQEKWIKDVCEALYVTKEALKPGLTGIEIDSVPRNFLVNKGYADYMPMPFVHSSGLSEYEKPFFGPNSDDIIQENQVLCIDIALFGHDRVPGMRVETGYQITKNGALPFSEYMEELFGILC
jgi:Xaa-Pro aminopeptidase